MRRLLVAILMTATLASSPAWAATIYVPADQPTIQAGIAAAVAGDTVLVACGTYYEHGLEVHSGVILRSESGQPDCVTIDAQQQDRVLLFSGASSATRIEGLTIAWGMSGGMTPETSGGGALCLYGASPVFTDCIFRNNTAHCGAGVCCIYSCAPTLIDCEFVDNTAGAGGGGGMWLYNQCTLTLEGCTFSGNTTSRKGGAVFCTWSTVNIAGCLFTGNSAGMSGGSGGAVHLEHDYGTVDDCVFDGNSANGGGGVRSESTSPAFSGCVFSGNTANHGGGLLCWRASPPVSTSLFTGNSASLGGAVRCYEGSPIIQGCTFYGNSAVTGGGAVSGYMSSPALHDCVVSFNDGPEAIRCEIAQTSYALSCSDLFGNAGGDWIGCIADQFGINGNFSADPMFCDPATGNFMLDQMSPCAPDNNSCGVLIGAYPVGCGASPVEATSWSRVKAMYW